MNLSLKTNAVAILFLAVVHIAVDLLPNTPFTRPMNAVLFATNLYVLYCANAVLKGRPRRDVALFLIGYLLLFGLTIVLLGKEPLFILLAIAYASVFGSSLFLGLFCLFVLCFVIMQPYGFETFIPLSFIYIVL
jgi:hypothetical protein